MNIFKACFDEYKPFPTDDAFKERWLEEKRMGASDAEVCAAHQLPITSLKQVLETNKDDFVFTYLLGRTYEEAWWCKTARTYCVTDQDHKFNEKLFIKVMAVRFGYAQTRTVELNPQTSFDDWANEIVTALQEGRLTPDEGVKLSAVLKNLASARKDATQMEHLQNIEFACAEISNQMKDNEANQKTDTQRPDVQLRAEEHNSEET